MSDSEQTSSSNLHVMLVVALAGAALLAYLYLLKQWRTPPPPISAPAVQTVAKQPPLELSRRLSPVAPNAEAPTIGVNPAPPSMLIPLLGFALALGTGIVAGRQWPRRTPTGEDAAEEAPMTAQQAIAARLASEARDREKQAQAARRQAEIVTMTAREPEVEPALDAGAKRELEDTIKARDEVIASLEAIVADNREKWGSFEQDRDQMLDKIDKLETELAGANAIVDDMQHTARRQQAVEEDRADMLHQVLERA